MCGVSSVAIRLGSVFFSSCLLSPVPLSLLSCVFHLGCPSAVGGVVVSSLVTSCLCPVHLYSIRREMRKRVYMNMVHISTHINVHVSVV